MTNPTPHGQVPEALIDLIDAYAETRHRCGGIYNAKTEAARNAVIEALSGVQALSAAPAIGDELRDTLVAVSAAIAERDDRAAQKMICEILAASTTPPAEQQAQPGAVYAELESELEAIGAGGVQALSAAPAEQEEAAQRLRKTLDIDPGDVNDPLHPRYIAGFKSGHAAGRRRAAPAASPTPPAEQPIGEVVVTKTKDGQIISVARQDDEGRILSVIATSDPAEQQATKETSGGFHVWRDISTAPKDGSRFVATGHNYGLYSEVRHTCVAQWFRGCWMEASDWNETSELKYLTHWMPLPSPPDDVAAPAEQQAAPKAAPVKACVCGEPQASGTVHRVDGPCYVATPQQAVAGELVANDIHGALTAAAIYLTNAQRQYGKDMHRQAIASLEKAKRAVAQAADFAKAAPRQEA